MPQISKIRIANFQYNDGKRLIADELYDFEGTNKEPSDVLINLANGGGKSVLVQLMMQPIIPKARVAGRKIESFFTKATDHCYVVLEWALDNSKMKLMTGIAMSASDTAGSSDSERGFQIKYYTFISSYQNYQGNYNIISLPLSNKEKGKYIPAAFDTVRNLAKKSSGALVRYASDDSMKWRECLAQYGIVQNEWHMIEELNSNEDGLSKYFSGLKSSDAVIDKLIIPRIEEKQNHSSSKDDSSLETMLISYANQFSKQQDIIKKKDVYDKFGEALNAAKEDANTLGNENYSFETCEKILFAYSDALGAEIAQNKAQENKNESEKDRLNQDIRHIEWERASAEYYACKEKFEEGTGKLQVAETAKNEAEQKAEEAEKRRKLLECARYYGQLKKIESEIAATVAAIHDRENNAETGKRLASLKYSACTAIKTELERLTPEHESVAGDEVQCKTELEKLSTELVSIRKTLEKVKAEKNRFDALLEKQTEEDDALAAELGVEAARMLDGRYQENELQDWKETMQGREKAALTDIDTNSQKLQTMEQRRESIPQELADANSSLRELKRATGELESQMQEFCDAEDRVRAVLAKHGLDYEHRFTSDARSYIDREIAKTEAEVKDINGKIEATEEAIEAVKRGTLHVPKLLLKYLDGTGLHYTTFEQYLFTQQEKGTLSKEKCAEILTDYPYAAYGVIVEERDKESLHREAESEWLPAVLPVFTAADVEKLLMKKATAFSVIAAYSQDYFNNSAAYAASLQEKLKKQNAAKAQREEREKSLQADAIVVDAFLAYDADWESRTEAKISSLNKKAEDVQKHADALRTELEALKEQINLAKSEEKRLEAELINVRGKLSGFEKFLNKLQEEETLAHKYEEAKRNTRELAEKERDSTTRKEQRESKLEQLRNRLKDIELREENLKNGLTAVADAAKAELVVGDWDSLLNQYKALLETQSADLKRLHEDEERLRKDAQEKQREIQRRKCNQAEYENLVYSEDAEEETLKACEAAEELCGDTAKAYIKANREQGRAEAEYNIACARLSEFGGEALPPNEVGNAFETRIAEIRATLADLAKKSKELADRLSRLQRAQARAETAEESYVRPAEVGSIVLDTNYEAQLDTLTKQLREKKTAVMTSRRKIEESFENMAKAYGADATISLAVGNLRETLTSAAMRGDRYYSLYEHIEAVIHTTELQISKYKTDLEDFYKTREDLIRQCMIQGKQMHEGLLQLSVNSKVKVQGKRRQMLKFDVPDTVDENVAKVNISAEIDKGTNEIVAKMTEDAYAESDVRKIASRTVGSGQLLRRYINADNIVLKAYKIDRNPDNSGYRTWEQTQINNSGAEKFVVYFAVILALMSYTRDGYDDSEGKSRSVLILDNPFGPISSRHVLEPMFEISRNYHVQMICLSDISKSDIVSCFELVIRAVVKRFALSSREQLTHEGNEMIEHGFYKSEQLDLFQ